MHGFLFCLLFLFVFVLFCILCSTHPSLIFVSAFKLPPLEQHIHFLEANSVQIYSLPTWLILWTSKALVNDWVFLCSALLAAKPANNEPMWATAAFQPIIKQTNSEASRVIRSNKHNSEPEPWTLFPKEFNLAISLLAPSVSYFMISVKQCSVVSIV